MSSPLSGTLGYLLIGEITAVTLLSWVTVGMFLRRLRYPKNQTQELENSKETSVEESGPYKLLMEKVQALEAEKEEWKKSNSPPEPSEVEKLKENVTFLENKLLGYEIVQEEIGLLGELKAENERLKLEIQALKTPSVVKGPVETVIEKSFSEFQEVPAASESPAEPLPGEMASLLTDIEKLSQK